MDFRKKQKISRRHAQCLEGFVVGKRLPPTSDVGGEPPGSRQEGVRKREWRYLGGLSEGWFGVEEHDARACRVCPQSKLRKRR